MRESRPLRPALPLSHRVRRGSKGSDGSEASLQSLQSYHSVQSQRSERSDQRSLDQRSLDQRSLDQRSLDQRSLDQRSLDQRSLDQRSLDQRSLDQRSVDERYGHEYPEFRRDLVDTSRKRHSLNSESSASDINKPMDVNISNNHNHRPNNTRSSRAVVIDHKTPVTTNHNDISRALESLLSPTPQKKVPVYYSNNSSNHYPGRSNSLPPAGKEETVFGGRPDNHQDGQHYDYRQPDESRQQLQPDSRQRHGSVPVECSFENGFHRPEINHGSDGTLNHPNSSRGSLNGNSQRDPSVKQEYEPRRQELSFATQGPRGQETSQNYPRNDAIIPRHDVTGDSRRPLSNGSMGSGNSDPALFSPTSALSPALPRRNTQEMWVVAVSI